MRLTGNSAPNRITPASGGKYDVTINEVKCTTVSSFPEAFDLLVKEAGFTKENGIPFSLGLRANDKQNTHEGKLISLDIKDFTGKQGNPSDCPVARAIERATGAFFVFVTQKIIAVIFRDHFEYYHPDTELAEHISIWDAHSSWDNLPQFALKF